MLKYILKRLGYSILVLLGVSLIIYFLTRLMPIDFVRDKVNSIQTSGAVVSSPSVVSAGSVTSDGAVDSCGFASP